MQMPMLLCMQNFLQLTVRLFWQVTLSVAGAYPYVNSTSAAAVLHASTNKHPPGCLGTRGVQCHVALNLCCAGPSKAPMNLCTVHQVLTICYWLKPSNENTARPWVERVHVYTIHTSLLIRTLARSHTRHGTARGPGTATSSV